MVVLSADQRNITDIIPVDLPRPRYVYDPQFVELRHALLDAVQQSAVQERM